MDPDQMASWKPSDLDLPFSKMDKSGFNSTWIKQHIYRGMNSFKANDYGIMNLELSTLTFTINESPFTYSLVLRIS